MPSKSANVKNEKQYEKLKEKGMSKERAAKIANSPGASSRGGKKSGSSSSSSKSSSSQGGTTAQKKAAGRKGGRATARKNSSWTGADAHEFVDWLASAGQTWWQVLPLGPPDPFGSPYTSPSAFAGWPALLAEPDAAVSEAELDSFRERHAYWIEDWERYAGSGAA